MSRDNKRRVSFLVSILMMLGLVFSNAAFAETNEQKYKKQDEQFLKLAENFKELVDLQDEEDKELQKTLEQMYQPEDNVRIIVELAGNTLSDVFDREQLKELRGETSLEKSMVSRQDRALEKINKELDQEFEIRRRYDTFFNGFSFEGTFADYKNLKNVRGIKNVRIARVHTLDMNDATKAGNINKIWDVYKFKGEGLVVSIIDTGIDWTHKDMRLSGKTTEQVIDGRKIVKTTYSALSMVDIDRIKGENDDLKGKYFTEKIPYGYNFADENTDVIPKRSYHGAHVAGIVGANATEEDYLANDGIRGVAPEVQLLAMKVFANNPAGAGAYEDDIVAAMEESVKVGADIMNLSLGSTAGFQTNASDLELNVVKKAAEQGVLAVISAGNSTYSTFPYNSPLSPDTGLIGSPSIAEYAFTVASAENTVVPTVKGVRAIVDGETSIYVAQEGRNGILSQLDGTYELVDCGIGGVEDFEKVKGQLDGKIAFIKRGTHYFVHKFLNAKHYGAKGVLLYSDEDRAEDIFEVPAGASNLPIAFISYGNGKAIHDAMLANKDVKVEFFQELSSTPNPQSLMMSDFTSWGPVQNLTLKPEITGFGGNILSTTVNDQYTNMSGTSMASPYVAGSMALILQGMKERGVNPQGFAKIAHLKRVAMNNADPVVQTKTEALTAIDEVDYSPRRQGAGLIDVEGAIYNDVSATYNGKPVVELKEITENETIFKIELTNESSEDQVFDVSSTIQTDVSSEISFKNGTIRTFDIPLEGAKLTLTTNEITVPANGSTTLTGILRLEDKVKDNIFVEGFIRFDNQDSSKYDLSIPYLGFKGEWDKLPIIDKPATSEGSMWPTHKQTTTQLFIENDNDGFEAFGGRAPASIGFNPEEFNKVGLVYSLLRNAEYLKVDIVNEAGNIIHTATEKEYVRKKHSLHYGDKNYSFMDSIWDGRIYDQSTGTREVAPNGQYFVRVRSKIEMEGAEEQVLELPMKVDTIAPEVQILSPGLLESIGNEGANLQFKAVDSGTGVNGFAIAVKDYFADDFKFVVKTAKGFELSTKPEVFSKDMFSYDDKTGIYGFNVPYALLASEGLIQAIGVIAVDECNNIGQGNTLVSAKIANSIAFTAPTTSDIVFAGKAFDVSYEFESNVDKTPDQYVITAEITNDDDAEYYPVYTVTSKDTTVTIESLAAADYKLTVEAKKGEEVLASDSMVITVVPNDIMVKFDNLKSGILLSNKDLDKDNMYEVTGTVYGPLKELRINDKAVELTGEGYAKTFAHKIKLAQDNNTVDIKKVFADGSIEQYGYQVWVDSIMPTLEIKDFSDVDELILPADQTEYTLEMKINDNDVATLTVNGEVVDTVTKNNEKVYTRTIKLEPYATFVDVKIEDGAENGIERQLVIYRGRKKMPYEASVSIEDESKLANGKQVKINAEITNKSGETNTVTLLVGIFSEDGRLVQVSAIEKELDNNETTDMSSILSIPAKGKYIINAYAIDNFENMNIIADGVYVEVGE